MPSVLFISKPVVPPWNDSNKNLVHDLAGALTRYTPHVMVTPGATHANAVCEPLYAAAGSYAPSRLANARVLGRLVTGPRTDLWHFFFSPNPLTLRAGRLARMLRPTPSLHTIASAPTTLEQLAPQLFADRVVALSEHTRRRLDRANVRSVVIAPALEAPARDGDAIALARRRYSLPERYVLYPGDLEFGDGARTFVRAASACPEVRWVVASRPKTPAAHGARERLQSEALALGSEVQWLGALDDIHAVVAGADAVVLVTDSLHGKMDWPLVLLEALALGVPVLVAQDTAAAELASCPAVTAVPHGEPRAVVQALRAWWALGSEARAVQLAQARAWVVAHCAPSVVAAAYEREYDALARR